MIPSAQAIPYGSLGRPTYREENATDHKHLLDLYIQMYPKIKTFPYRSRDHIRAWQFQRLQELVSHAYNNVPFYTEKYRKAGFHPRELRTFRDFEALPLVTKEELIDAWPDGAIAKGHTTEFTTRSSGSSGKFVTLAVDKKAVMLDTIMGCRQVEYQSGNQVGPRDLTLHIYTCPWWFTSVGGVYQTLFLPTSETPTRSAEVIKALRPAVISLYPSYLRELYPILTGLNGIKDNGTRVVIVHSEQSTKDERKQMAHSLGIQVLDEYSSEELTRIALECPYQTYHIEEDACYLEIVDQVSGASLSDGRHGEVIGTNLLNEATPLIRYKQEDLAALTPESYPSCECGSNFRQLSVVSGRKADSLVTPHGKVIPSGTLMDSAYRWFLDLGIPVHGLQYEIIQREADKIMVHLVDGVFIRDKEKVVNRIRSQLEELLDHECYIEVTYVTHIEQNGRKYRPIRREV